MTSLSFVMLWRLTMYAAANKWIILTQYVDNSCPRSAHILCLHCWFSKALRPWYCFQCIQNNGSCSMAASLIGRRGSPTSAKIGKVWLRWGSHFAIGVALGQYRGANACLVIWDDAGVTPGIWSTVCFKSIDMPKLQKRMYSFVYLLKPVSFPNQIKSYMKYL